MKYKIGDKLLFLFSNRGSGDFSENKIVYIDYENNKIVFQEGGIHAVNFIDMYFGYTKKEVLEKYIKQALEKLEELNGVLENLKKEEEGNNEN